MTRVSGFASSNADNITLEITDKGDLGIKEGGVGLTQLNTFIANSLIPVGAILPWLKSYTNTPALPSGFVECNGQVLDDAESVFDTQTIPDLNGEDRFLYGDATSGSTKLENFLPNHNHNIQYGDGGSFLGATWSGGASQNSNWVQNRTSGTAWAGYSVVWIVRVK